MTIIIRTSPVIKIIKNGNDISVRVLKKTLTVRSTAMRGAAGLSAYQIWLSLGNEGTEQDFINSFSQWGNLHGDINTQTDLISTMLAFSIAL